jgi:hypothetical protein
VTGDCAQQRVGDQCSAEADDAGVGHGAAEPPQGAARNVRSRARIRQACGEEVSGEDAAEDEVEAGDRASVAGMGGTAVGGGEGSVLLRLGGGDDLFDRGRDRAGLGGGDAWPASILRAT